MPGNHFIHSPIHYHSQLTPALPAQHRSSSDSNLHSLEMPRPGSGSGPGEEVGVAGSGTIAPMSIHPPSLPESSSTSAESLGAGRQDDGDTGTQQPLFTNGGIYFTYIKCCIYSISSDAS